MTHNKIVTGGGRNSSIELLRIFAACMVITLHYNGLGHALESAEGFSHTFLMIMEAFCVPAVDIFIMISGFFLCTTTRRTLDKPLYLLLLLSIISIISYISGCLLDGNSISVFTVFHTAIPPKNYFILLYITLYIISPYINLVIRNLQEERLCYFVILILMLFSIYPTLMDTYQHVIGGNVMGVSTVGAWGQQHGYTIVNFVTCYILGAFVRLSKKKDFLSKKVLLLLFLFLGFAIFLWLILEQNILGSHFSLAESNALSYSNPLVLGMSFSLLMVFSRFNFSSKLVNTLSKPVFVCYLVGLFILPRIGIAVIANYNVCGVILHLGITILSLYLLSFALWKVINAIISPLSKKVAKCEIVKAFE